MFLTTMKILIFSVILVTVRVIANPLVGQRETKNIASASSQSQLIRELDGFRETIENKFETLQETCQKLAIGRNEITISTDEEEKLKKMMAEFEDKMLRFSHAATEKISEEISEALENSLKKMDEKLQPLQSEIASVKSQMTVLVTKEDVKRLEHDLITIGTNATTIFKAEMSQLLTKEDILNHHSDLKNSLEEIFSTPEIETRCEDSSKLEEISAKLTNSDSLLNEVFAYLKNDSRNSYCSSTMDGITELLGKLENGIDNNWQSAVTLETVVQNMQKNFLSKLENLYKLAENGEANSSEEETEDPIGECMDSKFGTGQIPLNVCQAAIRFQKCRLDFVAFHCCQSCQKAGLLSSLPRYTGPRDITELEVLRSMKPFA
ncbi:polyamine-modulated factor 1-binding protein 1-like [Palaemon carinicauda]|uniref:polyamine-modulated factor 1-binding protein 1-like n=1 Tax=Palaemon carinicauda TaxID=392227 RepID=UPI0035B60974